MYIRLKNKNFSKKVNDFLEKNKIKYFFALDGENIRDIPHKKLWKDIAYVPQAKSTVAAYTVEEMVLLGRSSHFSMLSLPKEEDLKIVHKVMEEMNLTRYAHKKC